MMRLIDKYLPSDYSDSVSKRIKPAEPLTPDSMFEDMFCNFPKSVDCLMKLRNALVKPFGLQGGGGFRNLVVERSDEEIILSKNDRHLCFWVGIFCSQAEYGWQESSVTTVVRFNNFCGNFSHPVVVGDFSRNVIASDIHKASVGALCDKPALSEIVQLTVSSSGYSLPYFFFDASDMNSRDPKLFYVNNQLKFKACEYDFGTGMPLRAQQAMLPDMIKFWQAEPGGPIQIIYGGFASKIMRRK